MEYRSFLWYRDPGNNQMASQQTKGDIIMGLFDDDDFELDELLETVKKPSYAAD